MKQTYSEIEVQPGWTQQVWHCGDDSPLSAGATWAPAPGLAGMWRIKSRGVWTRWIVAL